MTGAPIDASIRRMIIKPAKAGASIPDSKQNLDPAPQLVMEPGSEQLAFQYTDNDGDGRDKYEGYLNAGGGAADISEQISIQFQDEGSDIGFAGSTTHINFVGAGVDATESGGVITVDIPAGAGQSGIQFQDEGLDLGTSGTVDTLNFTGSGVTSSRVGDVVTVNIPITTISYRGAVVQKSVSQAVGAVTDVDVTFDTTVLDTDSIHNPSPNTQLIVPAGIAFVRVFAQMLFTGGVANREYSARIIKNGTTSVANFDSVTGTGQTWFIVTICSPAVAVTPGDIFVLNFASSASMAGGLFTGGAGGTRFEMQLLG